MPLTELGFWCLFLLRHYLYSHDIARLTKLETGFVLAMEGASEPSVIRRAVRKHAEQEADSETAGKPKSGHSHSKPNRPAAPPVVLTGT